MRRILVFLATTVLALVSLDVSSARADGGSYPSQAPVIASGSTVAGGATDAESGSPGDAGEAGTQYYKVTLGFGDHLTADFTQIAGGGFGTGLCVYEPGVSDYTVEDANCLTDETTGSTNKAELSYVAPSAGDYILSIYSETGGVSWAYNMTVRVAPRVAPTLKLRGPKTARVHQTIRLKGTISPALSKELTLKSKSPAHGWIVAGKAKPVNGHFSFSYYLGHRGRHEFQVYFAGGGSHDAASSKVLRVNAR